MLDLKSHPIELLDKFETVIGKAGTYEFGKYIYVPQEYKNRREIITVTAKDARLWFLSEMKKLAPGEELAFQSRVVTEGGESLHIPMIDFISRISKKDIALVQSLFKNFKIDEIFLFETGRSFHIYGCPAIPFESFQQYIGALLLVNPPGKSEPVDTRWVGHQLINGYTALRWTYNSNHYKQYPKKISVSEIE